MKKVIFIAFALCATFTEIRAQLETVNKPFVPSKLAVRRLVYPNNEAVVGGQVPMMSHGWKRLLKSGITNSNGFFEFKVNQIGTYYLRISGSALRQYNVNIDVKHSKRKMVKFRMDFAI